MHLEKFSANPNCGAFAIWKMNTPMQMFYFRGDDNDDEGGGGGGEKCCTS